MSCVGENGFQDWKENPDNPSFALRWKRIHGVYLCFLSDYSQTSYCCMIPMDSVLDRCSTVCAL